MFSIQLLTVLSVAGLTAAAPQLQPSPVSLGPIVCPTICIDGINTQCNLPWGGCYDSCNSSLKPTMPPCPSDSVTGRPSPRPTAPPVSPSPITVSDNCSTRTICIDYVNECGGWYGGCHSDCKPWPSYTAPPCPSSTSTTDDLPVYPTPQ